MFSKKRMLLVSGEPSLDGIPLNYQNDLVVRTPPLWLCVWNDRRGVRSSFVTANGTDDKQTVAFTENRERVFSGAEAAPYALSDSADEMDVAKLASLFRRLGGMWPGRSACCPGSSARP